MSNETSTAWTRVEGSYRTSVNGAALELRKSGSGWNLYINGEYARAHFDTLTAAKSGALIVASR